jgi:choline dehydrogenase-like flavoprotein
MQILVVGAGAVGGYFGGRLAEANRDVTFLVRARRAEEIKTKGLQIASPHGNLTLHQKTITADRIKGAYDSARRQELGARERDERFRRRGGTRDDAQTVSIPLALPYYHTLTGILITHCSHHAFIFLCV